MDNHIYLKNFWSQVKVIDTVRGWIGVHPTLTSAMLTKILCRDNFSVATDDEKLGDRDSFRD